MKKETNQKFGVVMSKINKCKYIEDCQLPGANCPKLDNQLYCVVLHKVNGHQAYEDPMLCYFFIIRCSYHFS